MKTKKRSLSIITLVALALILTTSPCHAYFGENSDEATSSSSMAAIIAGSAVAGIAGLALAFGNFFGKNSPSKNTVTYNSDGANFGTAPVDSAIYDKGSTPKALGNSGYLGKPGFEFLGWSTDPNATKAQYVPGENIDSLAGFLVLYPIFGASITYKDTSGAIGNPPVDNDKYVENYPVTVSGQGSLSRINYFFQGWSITDGALSPDYRPSDKIIIPKTGSLTLYAVWSKKPWCIEYYANDASSGTAPKDSNSYNTGDTAEVLGNTGNLVKDGFHFLGWNTNPEALEAQYVAGSLITNLDSLKYLHAIWVCNIKYHSNGNNTIGPVPADLNNYINGSSASIANQGDLSNKGYYFNNWSTNKDNTTGEYKPDDEIKISETGDLDLYAIWNAKPYSITYNPNNPNNPNNQTSRVIGNVPIDNMHYDSNDINIPIYTNNASVPLTNPGFKFSGWNIDPKARITKFENNVMANISDNTTLYAIWTSNIVYDRNGADDGTTPSDNRFYTYNEVATLSDGGNLTRANYHIGGWQYGNDTDAYNLSQRVTMEKNLYFTVKWIENPYRITYTKNGAEYGEAPIDDRLYNTNDSAAILDFDYPLVKSGYEFIGWSTELFPTEVQYIAGNQLKGNIKFGYNDIILYPVWLGAKITYNASGAAGNVPVDETTYILNSTAVVRDPGNNLTKDGYYFHGWTKTLNSSSIEYLPNDWIQMTDNITLYAVWNQWPFNVAYYPNGATSGHVPDTVFYNSGEMATVLGNTGNLIKDGFNFLGWNTNFAASEAQYVVGELITILDSSISLYAIWKQKPYKIIYNSTGAIRNNAPVDNSYYDIGDTAKILNPTNSFVKIGYVFMGWSTDPSSTEAQYIAEDPDKSNITFKSGNINLYPVWKIVLATIRYDITGVSGNTPQDRKIYKVGDNVVLASTSTLISNTTPIIGWNTKPNGAGFSYKSGSNFTISDNTIMYVELVRVGSSYGGGTVIAVGNGANNTTDPKKILIMANADQSRSAWSTSYSLTNATHGYYDRINSTSGCGVHNYNYICDTIGSGNLNTASIISALGNNGTAAQAATNYDGGGFEDWYLPSMWELNAMRTYFNASGRCGNNTSQPECMDTHDEYWSSTEMNSGSAWAQAGPTFYEQASETKSSTQSVRAVRNEDY